MPAMLPLITGAVTFVLLCRYPTALAAAAAVVLVSRFAIARRAR